MTGIVGELSEEEQPRGLTVTATGSDVAYVAGEDLNLKLLNQRFKLAASMLTVTALLASFILGAAYLTSDANYAQVKELAPIVFTPIVTLLGTSVAWYYASDSRKAG